MAPRADLDDMVDSGGTPAGPIERLAARAAAHPAGSTPALVFLFAALMPILVAAISWNLYLDRLSDYFVPPVGNAARLLLALGMAAVAAVLAGFVALLVDSPEAAGLTSLRDRFRRAGDAANDDADDASWTRRRRVDLHPDDPVRPPIRAVRDLPAGGRCHRRRHHSPRSRG